MPYNDFMKGSALGTSYFLKASRPVDSKTIAGTLDDVYNLDENYRFEGLVIFVLEKGKFYYFRDGVTDDCLKPVESGSVTFLDYNELNTYSIGDYVLRDCKLYEAKQDNITGLWDETKFDLIIGSDGVKFEDFDETKDYVINELVLHDHKLYKCITDSSADIWENVENNFEIAIGVEEDKEVIKIKEWKNNTEYKENIFAIHDNNLYKCNTTHTSSTDFDTDKTMWDLMIEGESSKGIEITEWISGTTYKVDEYVVYDKKIWKCIIENSDVDFTEANWSLSVGFIEDEFIKIKGEFDKDVQYSVDDYVVYNNSVYKCITPNTLSQEFNPDEFELIIGGGGDAESIAYTNAQLPPTIDNVKLTLDEIIHKLYYVAPQITSFTTIPSQLIYEVGEIVNSLVFNWTYNKNITTQTLTDCILTDETDRTATYSTPITTNKTFTLTCSDGENSATKTVEFKFVNAIYYGVVDTVDEASILANCTKLVQDKADIKQKFTSTGNSVVLAIPTTFGELKSIINQNEYKVLSSFTKQDMTINGIDYYVYSLSGVYLTDFEYTFKF